MYVLFFFGIRAKHRTNNMKGNTIKKVGEYMRDFNAIGKTVGGNEGSKCNYPFRLDTYGCGCQHDCDYCYAKTLLDFRNLWDAEHPSVGNISAISKEIRKIPRGTIVRLGGMTDCFQPCEKIHRITYKTIKLLNRRGIGYLIVTKSDLVASDEYMAIYDPNLAHIQITVTTLDDDFYIRKGYEKASLPSRRIEAIRKLQAAGFDVSIRISPYIPEFIATDQLNGLGIKKCLVEFLRVNTWVKRWFDIDFTPYTHVEGGYNHLPLTKKVELIQNFTGFDELTVCEDSTTAFEYWKNNINHNPNDCCNLRKGN